MPHEGSRTIGRAAAVALVGAIVAIPATPAMAAEATGPAPDGTRVTGVDQSAQPDGTRVTGTGDGHPWIGSNPTTDGNPGIDPWGV
jgi:hypothetical protein